MIKGKEMKQMVGSPGTWSGMVLRVSQCVFAAASVCAMVTAIDFSDNTIFCFMNTTMLLQTMWSLGLACLDIYAMKNRKDLHERALVILLVIGDCILAFLTFSAASASNGVANLIVRDVDFGRRYTEVACGQITLSIVLAFSASLLEATSALSMLALLASSSSDPASL